MAAVLVLSKVFYVIPWINLASLSNSILEQTKLIIKMHKISHKSTVTVILVVLVVFFCLLIHSRYI